MKAIKILLTAMIFLSPMAWAQDDSEKFKEIYEREWAFRLAEFPTLATWVGVSDYNDRLGHVTVEHQQRRLEYWKGIREELNSISCERL